MIDVSFGNEWLGCTAENCIFRCGLFGSPRLNRGVGAKRPPHGGGSGAAFASQRYLISQNPINATIHIFPLTKHIWIGTY